MSLNQIKKEIEDEFDNKFPELLKQLEDPEHHQYKFLFERQNREIKAFLSSALDKQIEEVIKIIEDHPFECDKVGTSVKKLIEKLKQ